MAQVTMATIGAFGKPRLSQRVMASSMTGMGPGAAHSNDHSVDNIAQTTVDLQIKKKTGKLILTCPKGLS